jgi:hypothetical protein
MIVAGKIVKTLGCLGILGFVAVTLSGCGKGNPIASGTTTKTAATHTAQPPTASQCEFGQLTVTASSGGAATGHIADLLLVKNTSTSPCHLSGYPGVAGLNGSGKQEVQANRTLNGFMGGVLSGSRMPIVILAPGATASSVLEGTDMPVGGASTCPTYPELLVTPPNTRQSVKVAVGIEGCSPISVHPVVARTSGAAPH